ncbi:C39 family peptidase [Selenomonas sp. TAMA-11512]|uniref:peptidase C39 n=1 Tax=Selenomonas sp. TAMA-11512 TaxID=3095337 RepID=UPI0030880FF0|nr:C39 family peptidase [Selenomonas sp. TAMA-11512]
MKTPMHYQISEYDCGPTTLLNAMNYLFDREQIPPDIIRNIMLYTLDAYGRGGRQGRSGTSCAAMMFLSQWMDDYGRAGDFPIESQYLRGESVRLSENGRIFDAVRRKGLAVLRLFYDVEHYVLINRIEDGKAYMFDPYFVESDKDMEELGVTITLEHPDAYNRIVPTALFEGANESLYALGDPDRREAVLLFNAQTKLTAAKTIEYFI